MWSNIIKLAVHVAAIDHLHRNVVADEVEFRAVEAVLSRSQTHSRNSYEDRKLVIAEALVRATKALETIWPPQMVQAVRGYRCISNISSNNNNRGKQQRHLCLGETSSMCSWRPTAIQ